TSAWLIRRPRNLYWWAYCAAAPTADQCAATTRGRPRDAIAAVVTFTVTATKPLAATSNARAYGGRRSARGRHDRSPCPGRFAACLEGSSGDRRARHWPDGQAVRGTDRPNSPA